MFIFYTPEFFNWCAAKNFKVKRKNLEINKKACETQNKKYFKNCENYLNCIVFILILTKAISSLQHNHFSNDKIKNKSFKTLFFTSKCRVASI